MHALMRNAEGMTYIRQLIRRLTHVKIRQCCLNVFKYVIDNKTDYIVDKNGVFFNVATMTYDRLHDIVATLKQHERTKEGRNESDA